MASTSGSAFLGVCRSRKRAIRFRKRENRSDSSLDREHGLRGGTYQEQEADRLGGAVRRPDRARLDPLVRWLPGGVRPPLSGAGGERHLRGALGGEAAELILGPLGPGRCRQGGGPDIHLLGAGGRRRSDQQLA